MNKWMTSGLLALTLMTGLESCFIGRKARERRRAARLQAAQTAAGTPTPTNSGVRTSTDTTGITVRVDTSAISPPAVLAEKALAQLTDEPAWTTFSGKAKMRYQSEGQDQDFTASFRVEKDKRIWVSITGSFLGITMEAARALITPDSIMAVERIHHDAYVIPFSEAGKLLPVAVSFSDLQDLILGRAFSSGLNSRPRRGDVVPFAEQTAEGILLVISNRQFTQRMLVAADGSLAKQEVEPEQAGVPGVKLVYTDYQNLQGRRFSQKRTVNTNGKKGPVQIDMEFTSAAFNESLDFSFSIPSKYTRKQPGQ